MARPLTLTNEDAGSAGDRKRVTTYIDPALWKRVRVAAVVNDLPVWAVIEAALVEYLDRVEQEAQ
ncbi:MAG: hypothetical protein GXP48_09275 [Acidobacteria bacterium]|nr:hypothetical protein [Acidobacteriota bacterium]